MSHLFPDTVSYNRFTELMQAATLPMTLFLKSQCLGKGTGISFIDSTPSEYAKTNESKEIRYSKESLPLASQPWV